MTCKDRPKETGLFSLEDAGERREELSSNTGHCPEKGTNGAVATTARLRLGAAR